MKHCIRLTVGAVALVAAAAFATNTLVSAQGQDAPAKGGDAGMGMDPAMMAEMMKLGTPGKEHAELLKGIGQWENTIRMRMAPDAPWMDVKGTMKSSSMLDRYLVQESEFNFMGMPMKGVNIIGFDNSTGEFTSMWADSMSTWWITSRGKPRADGVVEFKGTMKDVAGERPFRMEIKHVGPDQVEMHMFDTIPPKGEVEVMQMISKRAGAAAK